MSHITIPKKFSMSVNFPKPFSPTLHESFRFKNETGETARAGDHQMQLPPEHFGATHFQDGYPYDIPEEQEAAARLSQTVENFFGNGPRGYKGRNFGRKMGGCI